MHVVNHNISKIFSLTRAEARLGWFMILNVLVCFDLVVDVWMCLFDLMFGFEIHWTFVVRDLIYGFLFLLFAQSLLARFQVFFNWILVFFSLFVWIHMIWLLVRFVWFIKRSCTFGNILIFLAQSVYVNRRNFYSVDPLI